jgi:hypothetical protein
MIDRAGALASSGTAIKTLLASVRLRSARNG